MSETAITKTVVLPATRDDVWRALTSPDELSAWSRWRSPRRGSRDERSKRRRGVLGAVGSDPARRDPGAVRGRAEHRDRARIAAPRDASGRHQAPRGARGRGARRGHRGGPGPPVSAHTRPHDAGDVVDGRRRRGVGRTARGPPPAPRPAPRLTV